MFSCEIFLTLGHDMDTNATTVQTHTHIYTLINIVPEDLQQQ
jgi:hypothetical protein